MLLLTIEEELVTYGKVLGLLAAVVLFVIATRYLFAIPTFLKRQKAIKELLAEIAAKQGVDAEKINTIVNEDL